MSIRPIIASAQMPDSLKLAAFSDYLHRVGGDAAAAFAGWSYDDLDRHHAKSLRAAFVRAYERLPMEDAVRDSLCVIALDILDSETRSTRCGDMALDYLKRNARAKAMKQGDA